MKKEELLKRCKAENWIRIVDFNVDNFRFAYRENGCSIRVINEEFVERYIKQYIFDDDTDTSDLTVQEFIDFVNFYLFEEEFSFRGQFCDFEC